MKAKTVVAVAIAALGLGSSVWGAPAKASGPAGVVLGEGSFQRGKAHRYTWEISTRHRTCKACLAPTSLDRPCLFFCPFRAPCLELILGEYEIGREDIVGGLSREVRCAPERITATTPPVVVEGTLPGGTEKPYITLVGMAFGSATRSLEATLADGTKEPIPVGWLTAEQAKAIHHMRFRYAAFAVRGRWCPVRIASRDARGQLLWESTVQSCPRDSEAPIELAGWR